MPTVTDEVQSIVPVGLEPATKTVHDVVEAAGSEEGEHVTDVEAAGMEAVGEYAIVTVTDVLGA